MTIHVSHDSATKHDPNDILRALSENNYHLVDVLLSGKSPNGNDWTLHDFEDFFHQLSFSLSPKECFEVVLNSAAWRHLPDCQKKQIDWGHFLKKSFEFDNFWLAENILNFPKDLRPKISLEDYAIFIKTSASYFKKIEFLKLFVGAMEAEHGATVATQTVREKGLEKACFFGNALAVLFLLTSDTRHVLDNSKALEKTLYYAVRPDDFLQKYLSLWPADDTKNVHLFFEENLIYFLDRAMAFFLTLKKPRRSKSTNVAVFWPRTL